MAKRDKGDFVEPNKRTLKEYLEYWLPIIKPSIAPKTFEGDEQKVKKISSPCSATSGSNLWRCSRSSKPMPSC